MIFSTKSHCESRRILSLFAIAVMTILPMLGCQLIAKPANGDLSENSRSKNTEKSGLSPIHKQQNLPIELGVSELEEDGTGFSFSDQFSATHIKNKSKMPLPTEDSVTACSYNIQFLGSSSKRRHKYIVDLLKISCDVVVIQELVAPPLVSDQRFRQLIPKEFPDGTPTVLDPDSGAFFDAMISAGYKFHMSHEDTGRTKNHSNANGSEWFVAFYRASKLKIDKRNGLTRFIGEQRAGGGLYDRVPYAFAFKSLSKKEGQSRAVTTLDFVLISVHLHFRFSRSAKKEIRDNPERFIKLTDGANSWVERDERKRHLELQGISDWISKQIIENGKKERDFIIIGDMNLKDLGEVQRQLRLLDGGEKYRSLNSKCLYTNSAFKQIEKCYDQVFYRTETLRELKTNFGLKVVDMVSMVKADSQISQNPSTAFDRRKFRLRYSDHFPIMFRLDRRGPDDD